MRAVAIAIACVMSACAPSTSSLPPGYVAAGSPGTVVLLDECDAQTPFRVGETVPWQRDGVVRETQIDAIEACSGEERAAATRYATTVDGTRYSARHTFFAVQQTREDDYIVQTVVPNEDFPSVSYSFVLRGVGGVSEMRPPIYDELSEIERRFCVTPSHPRPHERYVFQCEFSSASNVRRFYHAVIYPRFRSQVRSAP